jgi:ketosteroid isomerase-like protein
MNAKTTPIQNTCSVLLKMEAAINAHDIDAFANCFIHDFVGEHPVHPERNLIGAEQVRKYPRHRTRYARRCGGGTERKRDRMGAVVYGAAYPSCTGRHPKSSLTVNQL